MKLIKIAKLKSKSKKIKGQKIGVVKLEKKIKNLKKNLSIVEIIIL